MALNDIVEAVREGLKLGALKNVEKIRAMTSGFAFQQFEIYDIYGRVAKAMRTAVLQSYSATVSQQRIVPSYQRENRLAGRLRAALSDQRSVVIDGNGILFPNAEFLDQEARHWRRLNFGTSEPAARARSREAKSYQLDFSLASGFFERGKGSRGSLTLAVEGRPSGPVLLGARSGTVEVSSGGGGGLNVFGKKVIMPRKADMRATRGIAARHFVDAGLGAAARELPSLLGSLTKEKVRANKNAMRGKGFTMHGLATIDDRT